MSNDTRPEIRFPGFTEDWEERKLGELTESFDGKRVPIDSDLRISGKYPYYGATGIIDYVDDYIFNGEYVLLAEDGANIIMRNYPVAYLTQGKFWLNNHAHIMRMRNGSNYFLVQVLEKIDYKKYNTGTAQPKLNSKIVKNIELKIPHIEEQQQIGNFFKQLGDIIALHQRKLDLLKETKKGFLQKMFPKNGAKVPEIRFPGFTEDWEQRKLGEVVERVTRKNKKLESIRPLTISAQEGLIGQNEFFNKTVASRDVSGYYLVKKGEFAYNKSYSNGYPWGAVKRLNQYDMGVLSTLYIVFKPKKIDSDFLEKYYDTTYWYKEVSKHAAEGARNHGLLNIAASDFFETEIVMPLKIEEQQKIGAFFKQLDDTIALHQRELDVLKETKKGFLQKMFV